MGRLAPYRKWGLMLIPLASVSTVPLVWFWGNHGGHSGHMPDSTTVSAEIQPPAPSSPLPPLSQIPLPPNTPTPSSVSGLKNPRPLMMSSPPKTTTKGNQASIESKNSQSDPGSRPSPSQPSATSPQSSTAITPSFSSPPLPQAQPRRQSSPPSIAYRPPLEIRVGIQRDVPSVMVTASTQAEIQNRHGQGLMTLNASQPLTFQSQDGSLLANGRVFPGMVWVTPTANSYLGVSDRWYRGRILLVARGNTVLAVNYLDLENYLISVVGSEMHSNAPIEALKAQAIAARSYALVHMIRPAGDWFDLGDPQRWQVYKGINSEVNSA
ncbi:MAG: hypothetical protein RLZZ568_1642, partial [Cyanobacteriota bacterium]